jgi:hypothetical protein
VQRFAVVPELLERTTSFPFRGHSVTLRMPSASESRPDDTTSVGLSSWRMLNGAQLPQGYRVYKVDITVAIPKPFQLPENICTKSPNARDLLTPIEQNCLQELGQSYALIARGAFDRWVRTVRWKLNAALVGRDVVNDIASDSPTYLVDKDTGKNVWGIQNLISIIGGHEMTELEWDFVNSALATDMDPPVFIDLFLDAKAHLMSEDVRRATIDAAIAAESCIRMLIQEDLPDSLANEYSLHIDEANIRPVMQKFLPNALARRNFDALPKSVISDLHELFDIRNKLVHKGFALQLDTEKCRKQIRAVEALIKPYFNIPAPSAGAIQMPFISSLSLSSFSADHRP